MRKIKILKNATLERGGRYTIKDETGKTLLSSKPLRVILTKLPHLSDDEVAQIVQLKVGEEAEFVTII